MYGIAVEYDTCRARMPDPLERLACQETMARRPGYRRRIALTADSWRRRVDLFHFADPEHAAAVLADESWRLFVAANPSCRDAGPALLVSQGRCGECVVLLRGKAGATRGGQACWRDHLARAEPDVILW
jgi:hypothetical protein